MMAVLDIARGIVAARLSIVPIKRDGSKAPPVSWTPYQSRLATDKELVSWFKRPDPFGIAVVSGAVSRSSELIDFDKRAEEIFPAWCELVEAERQGLVAKLSVVRTPRPGYHVRYCCPDLAGGIPGNDKLAEDAAAKDAKDRTLIETRGEGGYALVPGTPLECHVDRRPYEHVAGPPLTALADITPDERAVLIRCAHSFDRPVTGDQPFTLRAGGGVLPGDEFNQRGPAIQEQLDAAGWCVALRSRGIVYMRRPGKDAPGWSATIGWCKGKDGSERLAVFSTNAHPFEGAGGGRKCSCYGRFAVYTLLTHGGDFKAAAKQLASEGYGDHRPSPSVNGHAGDANEQAQPGDVGYVVPPVPKLFEFVDSATFIKRDCRLTWAIPRLLVLGQPAVFGGPQKSLKTSSLIEMAVAMGAPARAFGYFTVPARQLRVGLMSGESGEAALQDTFRRVTAARGVDPSAVSIFWGLRLPSLADPAHLDALAERVQERRLEVIAVDPLYLSLMAGLKGADFDAKNLYDVGPLLAEFSRRMLGAGATPVLCHHFKQTRMDQYAEPDLGDLTYAGIREYARQWILVGRRSKYEHDGRHRLHLVAGGSIGHSYAYALDVNEGTMAEDFTGRIWETTVGLAGDVRRHDKEAKQQAKGAERQEEQRKDENAVMKALDTLDPKHAGYGAERVRALTGLSRDKMAAAVARLTAASLIRPVRVTSEAGKGAQRPVDGIVRTGGPNED